MAQLIKNIEKQKIIGAKAGDVVYVNDDGNLVGGPAPVPAAEDLVTLFSGQGNMIVDLSEDEKKIIISDTDVEFLEPEEFDDIVIDPKIHRYIIKMFDGLTGIGPVKCLNPEELDSAPYEFYYIGAMEGFSFGYSVAGFTAKLMANGQSPTSLAAEIGARSFYVKSIFNNGAIYTFPEYYD